MKGRYSIFFVLGFCICGLFWVSACNNLKSYVEELPDDSYPEEILEEFIESYTGLEDIDLTPDSPEEQWEDKPLFKYQ